MGKDSYESTDIDRRSPNTTNSSSNGLIRLLFLRFIQQSKQGCLRKQHKVTVRKHAFIKETYALDTVLHWQEVVLGGEAKPHIWAKKNSFAVCVYFL